MSNKQGHVLVVDDNEDNRLEISLAVKQQGDTVNMTSRIESHALAGHIQVGPETHQQLQATYRFTKQGKIEVKTYFLRGKQ